jgi:opacity protein-like surface antigen
MLRITLAAVLLAVLLPDQARAADVEPPGAYVETRIGLFKPEDSNSTYFGNKTELTFDPGWAVEVATGYHINDFIRAELALAWRQTEVDDLEYLGSTLELDEDYIGLFTAMANGYIELPLILGVRPFIGGGAGFAYFDVDLQTVAPIVAVDSGDFTFAWQGIVGLAFHITPQVAFTGTYTYLGTSDTEDDNDLDGLKIKDYRTHTLMAGLRYYF